MLFTALLALAVLTAFYDTTNHNASPRVNKILVLYFLNLLLSDI